MREPTRSALGPLRAALPLALVCAAIKLLLQLAGSAFAQHAGYGIFRDELYYLVCGRNLAWGYLDHPPLVALEARLTELAFGLHSLPLLRLGPGLAGAMEVALTVLLAAALNGGRMAQVLAALGVLCSPIIMGVDANLSMNGNEPVFWLGIALALTLLARLTFAHPTHGAQRLLWLTVGVLAGIGLLNKWNIAFFLLCSLGALLLSPQRGLLRSRWLAAATVLGVALALPISCGRCTATGLPWSGCTMMRRAARTFTWGRCRFSSIRSRSRTR